MRQGADKIVSSAKGLMKDIFTITIGRQAPLGGIRFDESDQNFDQQPSLSLLPRILCLPIETLINISSHNLSERNRDMIVGMLADTCCERLEHFITQVGIVVCEVVYILYILYSTLLYVVYNNILLILYIYIFLLLYTFVFIYIPL